MRVLAPLIFGVVGCAILVSLGVWQIKRLAWKEGLLAQIEARMDSAPVALTPDVAQFQPVDLSGRFTGQELHVLTSIKRVGAVYRIVAAFETDGGQRVLVDRGWIPTEAKDTPRPATDARIVATLRNPEEVDSFTPQPDLEGNIWFARDTDAMASALNTDPVFLILRETSETDPPVTPLPVDTVGIPNDHLQYALTWFSLAVIWAGMTGYFIWRSKAATA